MKKVLSMVLTLVIFMGVFTSVYTPVNAVETSEPITQTETDVTESDISEPETTEPSTTETDTSEAETTVPETTEPETTEPETTEPDVSEPVLAIPADVKAVNVVGGISVSWSAVDGATSYNIYRKADGEEEVKLVATVAELIYVDESAVNSVTYEYSVSALKEDYEGDACEPVSVKYVVTPNLRSASNKSNGVEIKWSEVEGATAYKLYRKTTSSGWKVIASNLTATSYIDETAKSGTNYMYTVRAYIDTVSSSFVKEGISVMRLATPDIKSVANAKGGIAVKWSTVKGAESYKVYRKVNNGSWKYIKTVTKTTYTDTNVYNGKTYRYTARAVCGDFISAYESGLYTKYVPVPKLTSVKNTSNGLKVSWKAVKNASLYKVYRRGAGQTTWDYLGSVKTTTFTDKKAVPYQTYRYSVRAVNGKMSGLDKTGLTKKFVPTGTWNKQVTYNFYKNAINTANETLPRYTVKNWQKVDSVSATGNNAEFVNEFKTLMDSMYYPASDPFVYKCAKGSEDSELLLPPCKAPLKNIKSATASKSGKNIVVKIVMVDEKSPEKSSGGIKAMSGNYFDLNSMIKLFKEEGIVTSGTSSSTYKNFTITATITTDGKIVSMKHSCENISMSMNMNFINGIGNVKYKSQIDSYLTYTGFKY